MIRLVSQSSTERPRITMLWDRYLALKSEIEELHRACKDAGCPERERVTLELDRLEPMLRSLDNLAKEIADVPDTSRSALEVKARVLLDYLDGNDLDAAQRLALSLCNSILASS